MSKFHEIFGKTLAVKLCFNFGGPAGGPGTWKGAWAHEHYHMTRRAFLSSKGNTAAREIQIKYACQKLV